MNKISISARLNSDIVQWLDSKATKGKTRSDVLNEVLTAAKLNDQNQKQIQQSQRHAELLTKGAQAAIMSLRILEIATKQYSDKGSEILKNAQTLYKKEMQITESEAELAP